MRQQLETTCLGGEKENCAPQASQRPGEGLWEQQECSQHEGGTIPSLLTSCSVMLMRSSCCRNCSRMYLGAMSTRDWKEKCHQRWLGQPWQGSELHLGLHRHRQAGNEPMDLLEQGNISFSLPHLLTASGPSAVPLPPGPAALVEHIWVLKKMLC